VMNAGVADQIGKPLEVYENPQTEFVAGFIGSPATNFMPAGSISVSVGKTVGIRPEHIKLTDSPTRLQARVAYCEALGAETLVHLRLPNGQLITVRQGGHLPLPSEGTDLWLGWDDAAMMVFGEDGKRI
jgi:sn-glycerol 3-phosphate transport system ATP-binding protein